MGVIWDVVTLGVIVSGIALTVAQLFKGLLFGMEKRPLPALWVTLPGLALSVAWAIKLQLSTVRTLARRIQIGRDLKDHEAEIRRVDAM